MTAHVAFMPPAAVESTGPASARGRNIKTALILKADLLYAATLSNLVRAACPAAIISVVRSTEEAAAALATRPCDLFVAGVDPGHGDVLDLLLGCPITHGSTHVLLLAGPEDERILAAAQSLRIRGVFDPASDSPATLTDALRHVAAGGHYWSPAHRHRLEQRHGVAFTRLLTPGEQLFFAVMGDGCDDRVAAAALGVSRHTVATVRRQLHRKLGIQHRGELIRAAVERGFVRFTAQGVLRPGLALLTAAHQAERTKRTARPAKVVELPPLRATPSARCA